MICTNNMVVCAMGMQIWVKMLKTAENTKNRRIQPKYRAHSFKNSFIALPVPENPMLEKRILKLSPIGKKLGLPYRVLGGHLGFWALDPPMDTFFRVNMFNSQEYS